MSRGTAAIEAGSATSIAVVRTGPDADAALTAAVEALSVLPSPDLLVAFIDSRFGPDYQSLLTRLTDDLQPACLVGCTGAGVIGPGVESEDEPAISLMAFRLPGAVLQTLAVNQETTQNDLAVLDDRSVHAWLLFADPFSIETEGLVGAIEQRRPDAPILGGMASAHNQARGTAVFLNGRANEVGAVLVGIGGAVRLEMVVAQGAEPIGQAWTVTDCERNIVKTLGFRPALEVLQNELAGLDPDTRARAMRNLLAGLAMDEYKESFGRGDYLIRNLMGVDQASGSIAINALPRVGQTFQFQFRDAIAADEDLRVQLATFSDSLGDRQVLGAVLCACNGRGTGLFQTADHDAAALAAQFGPLPTAGLFCNGEIGPVGGKSYVHGFTASIGLFTVQP